jgi:hypothetical protein
LVPKLLPPLLEKVPEAVLPDITPWKLTTRLVGLEGYVTFTVKLFPARVADPA